MEPSAEKPSKVIAKAELAKHNKRDDCWVSISGKVYDVTPFLDDHPGGSDIILDRAGQNATSEFIASGHSDRAKGMLPKYYVGEAEFDPNEPTVSIQQNSGGVLFALLGLLVGIIAFAIYWMNAK